MADQQVERTIEAHFEIIDFEETVYEEPAEGPKLTRVTIRKHYRGAIDGTSVAGVLTAQGAAGGGYVASERIEGTLDGRQGTFVIQHNGRADGNDQSSDGSIIPGSGTGGLAGISGRAMERQFQVLTLVYTLGDDQGGPGSGA
ncbi:DUF3224 domain-containing protein [Actinomadura xylanilytica]|uniref:DUF3224 domain-containing protein n=1 Tax=Actinomadura xylanilytica TaxID=887459 RepID=UPI00255B034C|nr:DUF3224 domain-containing protein [Actinomadura xylanilytica]MDL4777192.1 DUF3224 domain-containing protein [Actinomadura xylanilytica]